MQNKLYAKTKNTQKLSSTFSHIPVQGIFESRSSVLQYKQQDNSQQPNLQKLLMQAERYGHHINSMHPTGVSRVTAVQPKMSNEEPTNKHSDNLQFAKQGGVVQRALNPAPADELNLGEVQRREWQRLFIDGKGSSEDMMAFANRQRAANDQRVMNPADGLSLEEAERSEWQRLFINGQGSSEDMMAFANRQQAANAPRNDALPITSNQSTTNNTLTPSPVAIPDHAQSTTNNAPAATPQSPTNNAPAATPQSPTNNAPSVTPDHNNDESEASAAEKPKKTTKLDKVKQYIPFLSSDKAKANKTKGYITTGALTGGSVANTAGQHSNLITHTTQAIAPTVGAGVALPLTILSTGRSGRQAYHALNRAKIASEYSKANATGSRKDDYLREIAQYTANKQRKRGHQLSWSSAAGTISTGLGSAALGTGLVHPVGAGLALGAGISGGIGALPSLWNMGKAGYKSIKGTKGVNRKAKATELYDLATKGGHENSINFMQAIGILKSGSRPNPEAKGYYVEDLQDQSKREQIIEYAMQKMRS